MTKRLAENERKRWSREKGTYFAQPIREERLRRGWTIRHVAEQTGVSDEAIRLLETGKRYPSYLLLIKLEDLFGMTHRELFAAAPGEPHNLTE